ncbi:hypothetical protein AA313_de0205275 [Arthrobotrys entomopaga]|nr:hypothetical protein AA313_de0205275 [Arthrobotrys entomopaga]
MAGPSKPAGDMGSAATRSIVLALSTALLLGTANSQNLNATALVWPFSSAWSGNDGQWGTFFIHVGTPSQIVRVLPAITWQETWVIDSAACSNSTPEACGDPRGSTFNIASSSTWKDQGDFKTDLQKDIGNNAIGDYGLERLGINNVDSAPTYPDQVVVSINDPKWYIGLFGLGNQPTNFTNFNNPQPSYLTSLYNAGKIPSLSWGYQAGAVYRGKTTSAQVVFGGYDDSRYIDNQVLFTQSNDFTYALLVAMSSLKVSGIYNKGQLGTAQLLDSGWSEKGNNQLIALDSTTPYIWLNNETCAIFESALNLTWNAEKELYLLTEDEHDQLVKLDPTFTFTLMDSAENTTALDITVPYSAFSLQARGPDILGTGNDSTVWYFPLKKLPEGGNPRLGRAFLQEVYLFAEYHFNTFRIFQADWSNRPQNIVTHLPVQIIVSKPKKSTPIGPIVGGVVGGVVVIVAIVGGFLWWRRRKQKQAAAGKAPVHQDPQDNTTGFAEIDGATKPVNELGGGDHTVAAWEGKSAWQANNGQLGMVNLDGVHEIHGRQTERQWNEADGTPIEKPYAYGSSHGHQEHQAMPHYAELGGSDVIAHEMPGSAVETRKEGK